jgi:predicted transcriptional regulator
MKTGNNDPFLSARLVSGYVRHHKLAADQLADLITAVHRAIGQLGQPREPETVRTPAVSIRQSVRHDYVVCLDCGYRGKTLRRHITIRHGLTGDEYRQRWGLRSDHPLTAPAYSKHRSTLAKELGLGRKSTPAVAPAPTPAASSPADIAENPKPKRPRRSRQTSKSEDTASKVAAATPTRRRRSRAAVAPQAEQNALPTDRQSEPA